MTTGLTVRTIPAILNPKDDRPSRTDLVLALLWGLTMTLCVTGYTFGQSNHHVYLLDALYSQHPENLRRDWFTTHTLQYHVLYTWLVVALEKVRMLETGFFLLYLVLAILMHGAWWSIVRKIGGDLTAYMISVLIYHLSGGGLGLGVYQFLQDGSFLPSNISAVAALMAFALWLDRRLLAASICVGISGLFHLNYSLMLIGFWGLFTLLSLSRKQRDAVPARFLIATLIAMTPCLINVAIAAKSALSQTAKIPIDEFVQLYVKLRHPHHYDAMHWPLALWISFLWPIPIALVAIRRLAPGIARQRLGDAFYTSLAIQLFAVTFAGIWFVSETIIQMSLFRFSIFAKLISCILTGWAISRANLKGKRTFAFAAGGVGFGLLIAMAFRGRIPSSIPTPSIGLLLGAGMLALSVAVVSLSAQAWRTVRWLPAIALPFTIYFSTSQRLGVAMPGESDGSMVVLSDWVRDNTPVDALFLVPPADSVFRLEAQRSAVIGFKHVPQLSGELVEWKRRLDRVLDCDILTLPTPMAKTLDAMNDRYAAIPASHFEEVGAEFDCDYVVSLRRIDEWRGRCIYSTPDEHYWLYRLNPSSEVRHGGSPLPPEPTSVMLVAPPHSNGL